MARMNDRSRIPGLKQTVKDRQTVTSEGDRVEELIDGVAVRHATTYADERGEAGAPYPRAAGGTWLKSL
jgi:hypothetical protein